MSEIQNVIKTLEAEKAEVAEQLRVLGKKLTQVETAITALRNIERNVAQSRPRELFYLNSRSGEGRGHYIERFVDGTFQCHCTAAKYGRDCWAVTLLKRDIEDGRRVMHKWLLSERLWDDALLTGRQ